MWLEGVKAKQTTSAHGRMEGRSISVLLRISCFLSSFFLVHYFLHPSHLLSFVSTCIATSRDVSLY